MVIFGPESNAYVNFIEWISWQLQLYVMIVPNLMLHLVCIVWWDIAGLKSPTFRSQKQFPGVGQPFPGEKGNVIMCLIKNGNDR